MVHVPSALGEGWGVRIGRHRKRYVGPRASAVWQMSIASGSTVQKLLAGFFICDAADDEAGFFICDAADDEGC